MVLLLTSVNFLHISNYTFYLSTVSDNVDPVNTLMSFARCSEYKEKCSLFFKVSVSALGVGGRDLMSISLLIIETLHTYN